ASTSITLSGTQQISVGAITLPAGVTAVNWYFASAPAAASAGFLLQKTSGLTFNINAQGNLVPAPTCSSTTCTYTDGSGVYNTQYDYAIRATYQNWTSTTLGDMALSLFPTSGTDDTTAGPNYNSVWVNGNNDDVWVVGDNGSVACTNKASTNKNWTNVTP